MRIRHGTCTGCDAAFTAYDGRCVVARLDPDIPRGTCKAQACRNGQGCPVLRASANLPPRPVAVRYPRLTEKDRRVFSVLTREFATAADIATRARLPTRTRADLADEICARLARYGLAESARTPARRLWRLRDA